MKMTGPLTRSDTLLEMNGVDFLQMILLYNLFDSFYARCKRLGTQTWMFCAIIFTEAVICIKAGKELFAKTVIVNVVLWIIIQVCQSRSVKAMSDAIHYTQTHIH